MDPIHPIVPQPPTLPPIAPAPSAARVNRDASRERPGGDPRRRRRPGQYDTDYEDELEPGAVSADGEDPGAHIDLTA